MNLISGLKILISSTGFLKWSLCAYFPILYFKTLNSSFLFAIFRLNIQYFSVNFYRFLYFSNFLLMVIDPTINFAHFLISSRIYYLIRTPTFVFFFLFPEVWIPTIEYWSSYFFMIGDPLWPGVVEISYPIRSF